MLIRGSRFALAVDWDDVENKPSTFAPATHTHTVADIDSEAATDGHVLTADGAGGAAFEAIPE